MSTCEKTDKITTANIGLPRVGEMFTSQITRGARRAFLTINQEILPSGSSSV